MLLNPAKNTRRQFLEAADRHGVAEGHEQGVHDALKDVKLDLVGDLILSLLRVALVRLYYVLIVPSKHINTSN